MKLVYKEYDISINVYNIKLKHLVRYNNKNVNNTKNYAFLLHKNVVVASYKPIYKDFKNFENYENYENHENYKNYKNFENYENVYYNFINLII